ncbi:hypothetical protein ACFVJ5_13955 [Nocardia sp. NPDC127606]|uniref:hypothetical protein n=1 Tax=Nocardia sp. NPDC127606 TaxID=3345406 RepID=UPI00363D38F2
MVGIEHNSIGGADRTESRGGIVAGRRFLRVAVDAVVHGIVFGFFGYHGITGFS